MTVLHLPGMGIASPGRKTRGFFHALLAQLLLRL